MQIFWYRNGVVPQKRRGPHKAGRTCVCFLSVFVACLPSSGPAFGAGVFSVGPAAFGLLALHTVNKHEQNKLLGLKNVVLMSFGGKSVTELHRDPSASRGRLERSSGAFTERH